jgi:hypothetical protein
VTLVARFGDTEQRIECGRGVWKKGKAAWEGLPGQPVAVAGAWTADDTYTTKLCFSETPFILTLTLKFTGKELHCDSEMNVWFGPTKRRLVGKAE